MGEHKQIIEGTFNFSRRKIRQHVKRSSPFAKIYINPYTNDVTESHVGYVASVTKIPPLCDVKLSLKCELLRNLFFKKNGKNTKNMSFNVKQMLILTKMCILKIFVNEEKHINQDCLNAFDDLDLTYFLGPW